MGVEEKLYFRGIRVTYDPSAEYGRFSAGEKSNSHIKYMGIDNMREWLTQYFRLGNLSGNILWLIIQNKSGLEDLEKGKILVDAELNPVPEEAIDSKIQAVLRTNTILNHILKQAEDINNFIEVRNPNAIPKHR